MKTIGHFKNSNFIWNFIGIATCVWRTILAGTSIDMNASSLFLVLIECPT